jgi:glycosyltransferase 2 family protein
MVRPHWAETVGALRDLRLSYLLLYFGVTALAQMLRTLRWTAMLRALGGTSFRRILPVSFVGYMATFTVPTLGELVRPVLIREEGGLRGGAALATVVVERILDGLIVALAALAAFWPLRSRPDAPPWIDLLCFGTLCFFVGSLLVVTLLRWKRERAVRTLEAALARVSQPLSRRAASMLSQFLGGVGALPGGRTVAVVVGISLAYWWLNASAMQVLALGFGLHLGLQATWATIGLIVIGFFIPSLAQLGTFHAFAITGLGLFLPGATVHGAGYAYVVTLHAAQVVFFVGAGLIALFSGHVRLAPLRRMELEEP